MDGISTEKLQSDKLKDSDASESFNDSDSEDSDASDAKDCCCGRARKAGDAREDPTHFTQPGANQRPYSHDHSPHVTDEVFNAASHLMGGMLSLLGSAALIASASAAANPWAIVAFSLYGFSLNFLFWGSFCHHAIRGSDRLMKTLRLLDYVAIYFLIPGTMSPVCLICLHSQWEGWVFFGTSWGLALLGVALQTMCKGGLELPTWASMTMYVTLGWFGFFLSFPAAKCLGPEGIGLIALGGIVYTAGGAIFTSQCPNPVPGKFGFHEIWHIFVLAGAGIHYAFNFFYVRPAMW
mmetsp:Transcript_124361/g.243878  ORF Transcript_124361/g.243878 Transcript_124361/m.243878 type:complete len:294 (+) Transcript_124361:97-978(+)